MNPPDNTPLTCANKGEERIMRGIWMKKIIIYCVVLTLFNGIFINITSGNRTDWNISIVSTPWGVYGWQALDLDSNGYPHIVYVDNEYPYMIVYAKWTGSSWNNEQIDVGSDADIVSDSNNLPHISYCKDNQLWYAKKQAGGNWITETVDASSSITGLYSSIDLDSSGSPHICYCDYTNGDVRYAKKSGTSWSTEIVQESANVNRWRYTSLVLDSTNVPHVSYEDAFNSNLCYAKKVGASWSNQIVDSSHCGGYETSIDVDSYNYPHISYYDSTSQDLRYIKWTGSSWITPIIIDSVGDVGKWSSLKLDSTNHPHISYLDYTNGNLKYSTYDGSSWQIEIVDSIDENGGFTSIDFYGTNPCISYFAYYGVSDRELKYAKFQGPILSSSPTEIHFQTHNPGWTGSSTFEIWNAGGGTLSYTISESISWITINPSSGSSTGEHDTISVNVINTENMNGYYSGTITITSNGGSGSVFVDITIVPPTNPILSYNPTELHFGTNPQGWTGSLTFEIWNSGIGTLTYTLSEGISWITLSQTSGSSTGEHDSITVNVINTENMNGYYSGYISISSNGGSGSVFVDITINTAPTITIDTPVNYRIYPKIDPYIVLISGTASTSGYGSIDHVEIQIDEGGWITVTGTTTWTYNWNVQEVTDGKHIIEARSIDNFGSSSTIVLRNSYVNKMEFNRNDFFSRFWSAPWHDNTDERNQAYGDSIWQPNIHSLQSNALTEVYNLYRYGEFRSQYEGHQWLYAIPPGLDPGPSINVGEGFKVDASGWYRISWPNILSDGRIETVKNAVWPMGSSLGRGDITQSVGIVDTSQNTFRYVREVYGGNPLIIYYGNVNMHQDEIVKAGFQLFSEFRWGVSTIDLISKLTTGASTFNPIFTTALFGIGIIVTLYQTSADLLSYNNCKSPYQVVWLQKDHSYLFEYDIRLRADASIRGATFMVAACGEDILDIFTEDPRIEYLNSMNNPKSLDFKHENNFKKTGSRSEIVTVDNEGDGNFTCIQDAIDFAQPGETIEVYSGDYNEPVFLNKKLTLRGIDHELGNGNDAGFPKINALPENLSNCESFSVISIQANHCNLTGFNLTSIKIYDAIGLSLINASNNTISNISVSNYGVGLILQDFSTNNTIKDSFFYNNSIGVSIHRFTENNKIINNTIIFNTVGIKFDSLSNNNLFQGNVIAFCENGVMINNVSDCNLSDNFFFFNFEAINLLNSPCNYILNNSISLNLISGVTLLNSSLTVINDNIFGVHGGINIVDNTSNSSYIIEGNVLTKNITNLSTAKPIYYYENMNGITIPSNAGEVILRNCSNFTLNNLILKDVDHGILLQSSNGILISNCTFSNNTCGITLINSLDNVILNSTFTNNTQAGINIITSQSNIINNNSFNNDGIIFFESNNLQDWSSQIITNNTINNKSIFYFVNKNNCTIPMNAGQIILVNCSDIIVKKQNISKVKIGIQLAYSSRTTISQNNITNCSAGLAISKFSNNNRIYYNNFINNSLNAYDNCSNTWNDEYSSGGNYWSDYIGADENEDGIGDTPFNISGGNNQDLYPFMNRYPPPSIVYVDDDYNQSTPGFKYDHFNKIQSGINRVMKGGTVFVANGTYNEYITIKKTISVIGENKKSTIIGNYHNFSGVYICANQVNITGLTIQNSAGLELWCSNNITISDNIIRWNGGCDLQIRYCNNSTISNNEIITTGETGTLIYNSNNFQIYNNNFTIFTGYELFTLLVIHNFQVYHNNFNNINGFIQVYGGNNNIFDNGYPSGGNYWSDYTGTDSDGDGIGDTPYAIPPEMSNYYDYYPLFNPFGPPHAHFSYSIDDNTVTFNASGSYDYDGVITSYHWDFGDTENGTEMIATHTYPIYTTYVVSLTVTDNDGKTRTISKSISLHNAPTITDNTPSTIGYTGDPITFNASITDRHGIASAWIEYWFGDDIHTNISLQSTGINSFYERTIILPSDSLDTLKYFITANDTLNYWGSTEEKQITLLDNDNPNWQNQSQNGTIIHQGGKISLKAQGRDNIALDMAWLATNESGEWQNFTGDPWFNQSFTYRKCITINHTKVIQDCHNFPVLISMNSTDLANHSRQNGDDFVFTTVTGKRLNHEIESYNSSTGKLVAWVNVTTLSSTEDTVLYLYYNNSLCNNQQNVAGTWDHQYVLVQHLGNSSGIIHDSSSYENDGTAFNGAAFSKNGKIGAAYHFDGINDYISVLPQSEFGFPSDFTISFWEKAQTSFLRMEIFTLGSWQTSDNINFDLDDSGTGLWTYWNGGGWPYICTGVSGQYTDGQWYYLTLARTGPIVSLYVNGELIDWLEDGSPMGTATGFLNIGCQNPAGFFFNGFLDEIQISKTSRNPAWIQTSFNAMNDPSHFITAGPEENRSNLAYGSPMKMQDSKQWQWSNFTWCNPSISNGTTIGWKIYYQDTAGNVNCTDIMSFQVTGNIPIKNLQTRWNFVSLPFNQSIGKNKLRVKYNGIEYSWQEAVNNNIVLGFIYQWNRTNQNYELTDTLQPGEGYWMFAYSDCELSASNVSSFQSEPYITDLLQKWNLIGSPNDRSIDKQNLSIQYNGLLYTWQEAVANTIVLGFVYQWNETGQNYQLTDVLSPGKSYWIYAYHNCTLFRPMD